MKSTLQIVEERSRLNHALRTFFLERQYHEVDTPLLVQSPGMEPNLVPMEVDLRNELKTSFPAGLITSPEYAMKKLLGLGCKAIFTLTHVFRNEEPWDTTHNPEFTMLEWYRASADYHACMDETEALVKAVGAAFGKTFPSFQRVRVRDLFLDATGIDLTSAKKADLDTYCIQEALGWSETDTESDVFYRIFITKVEPFLPKEPIFVYEYPAHQASLSRLTSDGCFGERFELYIDGLELCNGFTELTNATEQRARFLIEAQERRDLGKRVFPLDETFLQLLEQVPNPSFGNALGVDRLHMIVTDARTIHEVQPFPASDLFQS